MRTWKTQLWKKSAGFATSTRRSSTTIWTRSALTLSESRRRAKSQGFRLRLAESASLRLPARWGPRELVVGSHPENARHEGELTMAFKQEPRRAHRTNPGRWCLRSSDVLKDRSRTTDFDRQASWRLESSRANTPPRGPAPSSPTSQSERSKASPSSVGSTRPVPPVSCWRPGEDRSG